MHVRKLDSLRALAALIVFVTHFSDVTGWLDGKLGGPAGQYGVMLFFLLSGFLMGHLYLDKPFNKANVWRYVLARVGRVVPLYLLVVVGSFTAISIGYPGLYEIGDTGSLVSHLLFLTGESVLWTIPSEMHFYFLFILFWSFSTRREGLIYLFAFAILIGLVLVNFGRIYGEWNGVAYNYFQIFRSLPYFLVGMLMGVNYKNFTVPGYLKKHYFILALLLIPLLYPEFSPITSDAKKKMWLSYEVLLIMSSVFFAVVFLVPNTNRLLANKIGDFLGKISYSLYLLHMPIIKTVNTLQMTVGQKLIVSFLLSIAVATVSFYLIEKPCAKWVRGIAGAKSKTNTPNNQSLTA